jgi:hypothetical protein
MEKTQFIKERVDAYLTLYKQLRANTSSDDIAIALLEQAGRDFRTQLMRTSDASQTDMAKSGTMAGDRPTKKQLEFLRDLGFEGDTSSMTREEVSAKIDELRA